MHSLYCWLLRQSVAKQNLIKLGLLAVAVVAFVAAMKFDSVPVGVVFALSFTALWFAHGWTSDGEDSTAALPGAEIPDLNPASGEPLIPGAHGLDQQGKPSGMR